MTTIGTTTLLIASIQLTDEKGIDFVIKQDSPMIWEKSNWHKNQAVP